MSPNAAATQHRRSEPSSALTRLREFAEARPRAFWIALIAGFVFPLYFPIAWLTPPERAVELRTIFDDLIPFMRNGIWIYSLVYFTSFYPLLVVRSDRLFHHMGAAYVATLLISFSTFVLMPVTTRSYRPATIELDDGSFPGWAMSLNFHLDPPYNCFPSVHVALAFTAAFCVLKADILQGVIAILVAIAISVSTLLVKQHYIADVIAGLIIALLVKGVVLDRFKPRPEDRPCAWPGAIGAGFVPVYGLIVVAVYNGLYLRGWAPWR